MKEIKNKYNPEYPYDNSHLIIEKEEFVYPIIERSNNGLLFPEGPKDNVDMDQFEE